MYCHYDGKIFSQILFSHNYTTRFRKPIMSIQLFVEILVPLGFITRSLYKWKKEQNLNVLDWCDVKENNSDLIKLYTSRKEGIVRYIKYNSSKINNKSPGC